MLNKLLERYFINYGIENYSEKLAHVNCLVFFILWVAIAFWVTPPPIPPGFMIVVLMVFTLTLILYLYIEYMIPKLIHREKHILIKTTFHWMLTGIIVGGLLCLLPTGKPFVLNPTPYEQFLLIKIMTSLSVGTGWALYMMNKLFIHYGFLKKSNKKSN